MIFLLFLSVLLSASYEQNVAKFESSFIASKIKEVVGCLDENKALLQKMREEKAALEFDALTTFNKELKVLEKDINALSGKGVEVPIESLKYVTPYGDKFLHKIYLQKYAISKEEAALLVSREPLAECLDRKYARKFHLENAVLPALHKEVRRLDEKINYYEKLTVLSESLVPIYKALMAKDADQIGRALYRVSGKLCKKNGQGLGLVFQIHQCFPRPWRSLHEHVALVRSVIGSFIYKRVSKERPHAVRGRTPERYGWIDCLERTHARPT